MKKLFTLIALLGIFCSGAWATDVVVRSWDFTKLSESNLSGETNITKDGTKYYLNEGVSNWTTSDTDSPLYGLTFNGAYSGGVKLAFYNDEQGIYLGGSAAKITIPNLAAGDKVIITGKGNGVVDAAHSVLTSGNFVTTVTMDADGSLDLPRVSSATYVKTICVSKEYITTFSEDFETETASTYQSQWSRANNEDVRFACTLPTIAGSKVLKISGGSSNGTNGTYSGFLSKINSSDITSYALSFDFAMSAIKNGSSQTQTFRILDVNGNIIVNFNNYTNTSSVETTSNFFINTSSTDESDKAGTYTLSSNNTTPSSMYHVMILGQPDGTKLYLTDPSSKNITEYLISNNLVKVGKLYYGTGKMNGCLILDNIELSKEDTGGCEDPNSRITGVSGTSRIFTLDCATEGAEIYYSESELATATGGTKYTGEVTTAATTIWAYAKNGTATSNVISFNTGAGTAIVLNAPTYSRKSYNAGRYTISLNQDQSAVFGAPDAVIKYSIDGGDTQTYSSDISVEAGSVVTAYSEKAGYVKSSDVIIATAARPTNIVQAWTQDYTQITKNDGNGALGVVLSAEADFTVGTRNFYNIKGYTANSVQKDADLNANVGINTATGFSLRCNGGNSGILKNSNSGGSNGYIGIQNLVVGDIIVITTNSNSLSAENGCALIEEMSVGNEFYFTATADKASIFFPHGTYNYVKTITVYHEKFTKQTGTTGFITFSAAVPVTVPEGAVVYTSTFAGETLTATSDENITIIPANTGVIVKGAAGANVTFVPTAEAGSSIETALTAAPNGVTGDGATIFGLLKNENTFAIVNEGVTLNANSAYLSIPAQQQARVRMVVKDETTGISNVTVAGAQGNVMYNVAGQRVNANAKGIVVINGKKFINK